MMIFSLTALICCTLDTEPDTPTRVKEFPEYSCQITLPDSDFTWSKADLYPGLLAEWKNETGISLVLAVQYAPACAKVDDSLIKQIQDSYSNQELATLVSEDLAVGDLLTFQKVPCYQYFLHFKIDQATTVARAFIANGYLYTLYLKMPQDQFEASDDWDPLFESFAFIGEPQSPTSSYRPPIPESRRPPIKFFATFITFFFAAVVTIFSIGLWYRNRNLQRDDFEDRY